MAPETKEDTFRYLLCQVLFAERAFSKMKQLYHQHAFHNPFFDIPVRILCIQSDYELLHKKMSKEAACYQEVNALGVAIDSLISYIQRKALISTFHKRPYQRRLRFIKRLLYAKGENQLLKLKKDIMRSQNLDYADWLLAKIQQKMETKTEAIKSD